MSDTIGLPALASTLQDPTSPVAAGVGTAIAPETLSPTDSVILQRDLWQHRRLMGFIALWTVVCVLPVMFFLCAIATDSVVDRMAKMEGLVIGLIVPLVGLAGAYMGLATIYGPNSAASLNASKG